MYFDKNYGLKGSDEYDAKFRVIVVDRDSVRIKIRNKKAQLTQQQKDSPTKYKRLAK